MNTSVKNTLVIVYCNSVDVGYRFAVGNDPTPNWTNFVELNHGTKHCHAICNGFNALFDLVGIKDSVGTDDHKAHMVLTDEEMGKEVSTYPTQFTVVIDNEKGDPTIGVSREFSEELALQVFWQTGTHSFTSRLGRTSNNLKGM